MKISQWFGSFLMTLAVLVLAGCGQPGAKKSGDKTAKNMDKAATDNVAHEDHDHGEGPHGGAVADWGGGKYHIEFTVNHDKQEATVYVLGADAKKSVPIKTEKLLLTIKEPAFQTDLKAAPQENEPKGTASRFVGKHEKLGIEREFAGTVSGEIDGTPYAGDFKEEPEAKKPGKK
jgi:hypothetical protein